MSVSKTPRKKIVPMPSGTVIEFTKRTVIGDATVGPDGSTDVLGTFFECVERDAREGMRSDLVSVEHYEMEDNLGVTKITVKHEPHGMNDEATGVFCRHDRLEETCPICSRKAAI